MKYLKSTLKDLIKLVTEAISVSYIAEPLSSFDNKENASKVRDFMNEKDFDVIGITKDGVVEGYASKVEIKDRVIGDYRKPLSYELPHTTSISEAFKLLKNTNQVFVTYSGVVSGIITKGDLQKIPVRMWLFSLVSLLEMQLLRTIRKVSPDNEWLESLDKKRVNNILEIQRERKKYNIEIKLDECLQLADKKEIILENELILKKIGIPKKQLRKKLDNLEHKIRNPLVHSISIITNNFLEVVELTDFAEELISKCEKI